MKRLEICYPNYSKKAITFTLDDGDIKNDSMMLSILRPAGILGTFNLPGCDLINHTREEYRATYLGYEIANHCKRHPFCFADDGEYEIVDEVFCAESADESKLYPHPERDGLYYLHFPRGWRLIARPDTYCDLVDIGKAEIEDVFGVGSVRGFVWPFYEQSSEYVKEYFVKSGYKSVRRTGCTEDTDAFAVPTDTMPWSYNARYVNLLELAAKYDAAPDDGTLKMFAFGVHSLDFERNNRWDDIRTFANLYGNRPNDFWYATVGDIFDYAAAARRVTTEDGYVKNNSETTIYIKLDDRCLTLAPGCKIRL